MTEKLVQTPRLLRLIAVILFSVLLTACGTDDGAEDPTATSAPSDAQPTVATAGESPVSATGSPESTSAPTNTDMSAVDTDATPADATPGTSSAVVGTAIADTARPASPGASPSVADLDTDATPVGDVTTGVASPVAGEAIPADSSVGDGTTGAVVPGTPEAATTGTVAATPIASPASPVAGASPAASLTVTGCDVPDVPPFAGEATTYRLTEDLNFRTGPGAECDLALPDPIGAFQVVDVIGGPVIREDDGSEWVQIRTLDTEGWVAFEFLEPVEE